MNYFFRNIYILLFETFLYTSLCTIFILPTIRNNTHDIYFTNDTKQHAQYMIVYSHSLARVIVGFLCHLLVKYFRNSWLYKNKSTTLINVPTDGTVNKICSPRGEKAFPIKLKLIAIMVYSGPQADKNTTTMKIICFNKRASRERRVTAGALSSFIVWIRRVERWVWIKMILFEITKDIAGISTIMIAKYLR